MTGKRITHAGKVGGGVTAGRHDQLMAITHPSRAYDGGGERLYLVSPTGRKIMLRTDDLPPGHPYTLVQLALLPIRAALGFLVLACSAYLVLFVAAKAFPSPQGLPNDPTRLFGWVGEVLAATRDGIGHVAALGGTPTPLTAAIAGVSALVGGSALRTIPRLLSRPHIDRDLIRAENIAIDDLSSTREPLDDPTTPARDRARRISGVQDAVAQLDAEWLAYEQDLEAYYLTKPVLRDLGVAETAAYRSALYDLRNLAEMLSDSSTGPELDAAERAADAALLAWGAANDHARAVGVSDRSPTERAALRRLHALVGQLADPSTPKVMWSSLVDAISREMGKLSTVPTSWDHLSRVPALEYRNPAAIESLHQ
jgi:hypothetical protein